MRSRAAAILALCAACVLDASAASPQRDAARPGAGTRATAPAPAKAPDVATTLTDAAMALGMLRGPQLIDAVATMEFWGTGTMNVFGQAYRPGGPWPALTVTAYHAAVDFAVPGMRVDLTRANPPGTVQGGGGVPLAAPQRQIQVVSGRHAWNEARYGADATPAMNAVAERLLQIWMLPHGAIKAARQAGAATTAALDRGKTVLTFPAAGTTMRAVLDAKNLVERVEAKIDTPALGDTLIEAIYSDYGDYNDDVYKSDVMFPKHIVVREGGLPILDLTITRTNTYNPYVVFPVPSNVEAIAQQTPAPPRVEVQKLADGVFYLTGGTHYSVAVEFADHVAVIEAPLNEARSAAVIDAIKTAIPNKRIRYLVNTHHHFDHSGGLRAFVAEGSSIVTDAANRSYYQSIWAQPHTIQPDRLARKAQTARFETVADRRVLSDGTRQLELYKVQSSNHADTMLIAYLRKEKILVEADAFTPPAPGAAPTGINREAANLLDNVRRLNLDVGRIAALHGRLADIGELQAAGGNTSTK